MNAKRCFKCREVKALDEFYKHPDTLDGHLNKCKSCTKRDVKENYASHREKYSLYEKVRNLNPFRRTSRLSHQRTRREKHPEKYHARTAVGNAIRDGRLIKQPCRICGNPKSQAHHHDYSKPLDVDWLCFKHHREIGHSQVVSSQ